MLTGQSENLISYSRLLHPGNHYRLSLRSPVGSVTDS